jgi:OmcA/MtrC family decaheme c-type cytochrome
MNWVDKLSVRTWSIFVIFALAFAISGCEGDDGAPGATGPTGPTGPVGPAGPPGPVPDDVQAAIDSADVESCGTCHEGAGDGHQAEYAKYNDASNLELTIVSVTSNFNGATYDAEMLIHVERDGVPVSGMSSWTSRGNTVWGPAGTSQMSFYTVSYDSANRFFSNSRSFSMAQTADQGGGDYLLTATSAFDPVPVNGTAYGYLAADPLDTEGMTLYDNVVNAALAFGDVDTYQSLADSTGCENCHGTPYMKHGYRAADVSPLTDFTACKSCHYDNRTGGHEDWQYMVDDPFNWATGVAATRDYDYYATVMNDTHMSHAMEFPYPQSMSNCNTCHEGSLNDILADTNFTTETCKSCHVVEGTDAWPADAGMVTEGMYAQPHRPPPLTYLWTVAGVDAFHNIGLNCQQCHGTAGFTGFADLHSGYDDHIYDDNGVKFADTYTVSIDDVSMAGNVLTIDFSASDPNIVAEVLVSLYGWDTKQFIIASHTRDGSAACNNNGCRMEYAPGGTNALFTDNSVGAGDYSVDLDLAAYVPTEFLTDDIPTLIANGVIKMAEITITPELELGGQDVVLKAVDETFDLNAFVTVDDYFKGANQVVSVEKCNACHDSMASTFHDGSGRGGDGIEVCKNCHVTTSPGSHLELASRAIDSYVHAIHTFQPFDEDDVDAANDPVFDAWNEQHKSHTFPYFTALSCEACHVSDVYNVPDQSESMPGVLRASWNISDRNIGTVPEYVTGPASRACGGCHRADLVVADDAGGLATFNAHTDSFGTLEENDSDDLVLYGIIDKIMSMFE